MSPPLTARISLSLIFKKCLLHYSNFTLSKIQKISLSLIFKKIFIPLIFRIKKYYFHLIIFYNWKKNNLILYSLNKEKKRENYNFINRGPTNEALLTREAPKRSPIIIPLLFCSLYPLRIIVSCFTPPAHSPAHRLGPKIMHTLIHHIHHLAQLSQPAPALILLLAVSIHYTAHTSKLHLVNTGYSTHFWNFIQVSFSNP